jgi:regulator of sigma E protease
MPPILHTLLYFLVALTVLIAFHEYGHFLVARLLGVKVLKFSIGFGKPLWRYQKTPADTEFLLCALPLGGYVKMVDEREGEVAPRDLPYAFNRQPLASRSAIVFAGPLFNFGLAILIYWIVFMLGETGIRPVLGAVEPATLAVEAGFREGDEILKVGDESTPTWNMAIGEILERLIDQGRVAVEVNTREGETAVRKLEVAPELAEHPDRLLDNLGLMPWQPSLAPLIDKVLPGSAAESAGVKPGDLLLSVDDTPIGDWHAWVRYVREHPERKLALTIERDGVRIPLTITPAAVEGPRGKVGQIGASVVVPEDYNEALRIEYRQSPVQAMLSAFDKTYDDSAMTLKMVGRMLVGRASVQNLSGPISIAQIVGQAAQRGFTYFLRVLAIVSVSLAVLNLLPIPVLDGGHLVFYLVEAIRGRPVSERTQARFQQVGLFILLSLMALAFYIDIGRLIG